FRRVLFRSRTVATPGRRSLGKQAVTPLASAACTTMLTGTSMHNLLRAGIGLALLSLASAPAIGASRFIQDPYPSTYQPRSGEAVLIHNGTVLTGTGERLDDADVLLRDGKVVEVGRSLQAGAEVRRVDARGRWVTPGLIDVHSHLGV